MHESSITIQIKIFDNYITFYNPGTLYGDLTVADLKKDNYQAIARNKLIAEAFYLTGDIEKYGSGFVRIRQGIKEYPTMKMEFAEVASGFLWTVSYTKQRVSLVDDKVTDRVTDKVTDNQVLIVQFISENNKITTQMLSEKVKISQRKIKENIAKLKEIGLIERIGSAKGGFWNINTRVE